MMKTTILMKKNWKKRNNLIGILLFQLLTNTRLQPTPTREIIAPEVHRRSSLPRYATGPTQETDASGTASRGRAGGRL
jgi:hypothetical protein